MSRTLFCASLILFTSNLYAESAPAEAEGLKSIFNGKNLDGWDGDSRLWSVKDGVIHGETTDENRANGNTFLIYQGSKLKDFELRLSFRCNATNNSGIQYRSEMRPDIGEGAVGGYQCDVHPSVAYDRASAAGSRPVTLIESLAADLEPVG